ncbi:MAG TPA: hypothetical protein VGN95_23805 [Pyrinomonadaceae bacterium]|jgi:hypothetical protein|nr:hypothetical protein [Pyrinomonadaceae bacterium]
MITTSGPVDLARICKTDFKREVIWVDGKKNAWRGKFAGAATNAGIIFLIFADETKQELGLLSNYGGVPARNAYWAA